MDRDNWDIIKSHQRSYPVQMVPLATDLGLRVYRVMDWPNNISGRLYKSVEHGGPSGFAIDVNGKHPEVRRRFTIAHEIAHFVLHRHHIGNGVYDDGLYRSGLPNSIEVQANKGAAEILMPRHLISAAMNNGFSTPEKLAQAFHVSEAAMEIRLGLAA
jgi:hypothetical protein